METLTHSGMKLLLWHGSNSTDYSVILLITRSPTTMLWLSMITSVTMFICLLCRSLCCKSEKAMAPHSSTLAWKIPWMEEPGGLQSLGSRRVGHDWNDLKQQQQCCKLSLHCFFSVHKNPVIFTCRKRKSHRNWIICTRSHSEYLVEYVSPDWFTLDYFFQSIFLAITIQWLKYNLNYQDH